MFRKLFDFLSDSFVYGLSGMFAQLVNFLLLPIYTRYLTLENYGTLALLGILTALFIPIAGLGLSPAIFRFYRDEEIDRKTLLSTGVFTVMLSSVALLVVTLYFAENIGNILLTPDTEKSSILIIITLCTSAAMSISMIFLTSLRANRRPIATVVVTGISLIIQVSLSIIFVVILRMGVLGVSFGVLCGAVTSMSLLFFLSRKAIYFGIEKNMLIKMLSYGIYSVPAQIFSLLNIHLNQFILKVLVNVRGLGLYSIAVRFALPITVVADSIQYAHTAIFFQVLEEEEEPTMLLRAIASYYVAILSYMWVGVSIWGVELLRFMTPFEFHEATVLIAPIAIVPLLTLIYTFLASGIDSGEDLKPYIYVNIVGFITMVISLYLLIPHFGVIGAAYSIIIARLVMIVISHRISQKRLTVPYNLLAIVTFILSGIGVIYYNNLWYSSSIITRLITTSGISIVYPFICLGILSLFGTERRQMRGVFERTLIKLKGITSNFVK